ncbi:MAG: hypothetical protein A2Y95_00385 [Deltaproteobacteria bacterium RBG_13_65_10]|jgi:death-on-curing protein|nr:MAG: hypothetical protein A2Y95_00385 [Deltaproteobacteria bacterium RBG_13_65_10]
MRFLTLGEVLELHRHILVATGGAPGLRDLGRLESAIAQPRMTRAARTSTTRWKRRRQRSVSSSSGIIPSSTDNKRVDHAAMETFLLLNGREIDATVDEQEGIFGSGSIWFPTLETPRFGDFLEDIVNDEKEHKADWDCYPAERINVFPNDTCRRRKTGIRRFDEQADDR